MHTCPEGEHVLQAAAMMQLYPAPTSWTEAPPKQSSLVESRRRRRGRSWTL